MKIALYIAIYVIVGLLILFAIWFFFIRKKPIVITDVQSAVDYIVSKKPNLNKADLLAWNQNDFLIALAKAMQNNQDSFAINGKRYFTADVIAIDKTA